MLLIKCCFGWWRIRRKLLSAHPGHVIKLVPRIPDFHTQQIETISQLSSDHITGKMGSPPSTVSVRTNWPLFQQCSGWFGTPTTQLSSANDIDAKVYSLYAETLQLIQDYSKPTRPFPANPLGLFMLQKTLVKRKNDAKKLKIATRTLENKRVYNRLRSQVNVHNTAA